MSTSPSISRRLGKAISDKLKAREPAAEGEDDDQPVLTTSRAAAEAALAQRQARKAGARYELRELRGDKGRVWYGIGLEGHHSPAIPLPGFVSDLNAVSSPTSEGFTSGSVPYSLDSPSPIEPSPLSRPDHPSPTSPLASAFASTSSLAHTAPISANQHPNLTHDSSRLDPPQPPFAHRALRHPKSSPDLLAPPTATASTSQTSLSPSASSSTPGRRPVDSFRAFSTMGPVGGSADVLGQIMGWTPGPVAAKERVEGSAKMEKLPIRLSEDGEGVPRESMSDLPGDLADVLGSPFGALTAELEGLDTPIYNSPNPNTTSTSASTSAPLAPAFTFGTNFSATLAPPTHDRDPSDETLHSAAQPARSMREVASSETIRDSVRQRAAATAAAAAATAAPSPPRYEDSRLFDLFEQLDAAAHDHAAAVRLARPVRLSDHARNPSTSSLASSVSNRSRKSAATASSSPSSEAAVDERSEDPRFVVYGWNRELSPAEQGAAMALSQSQSSLGSPSSLHSPSVGEFGRRSSVAVAELERTASGLGSGPSSPGPASLRWHARRRSATGLESVNSALRNSLSLSAGVPGLPKRERVVLAATVEWLVAELTARNSPTATINFFLTFRSFLRPEDLLTLLLTRFEWALRHPSTAAHARLSAQEAATARSPVGRVVAVRCQSLIRHWLLNHFADDWVDNKGMRKALPAWIKRMSKDPAIKDGPDYTLVTALAKVVRAVRDQYKFLVHIETAEAREQAAAKAKAAPLDFDQLDLELEPAAVSHNLRVGSFVGPGGEERKGSGAGLPGSKAGGGKGVAGAKDALGKLRKLLAGRSKAEPEAEVDLEALLRDDDDAIKADSTGDLLFRREELRRYLAALEIEQHSEEGESERAGVPVLDGRRSEDTPSDATLDTPRDSTASEDRDDTVQIAVNGAPVPRSGLGISTEPRVAEPVPTVVQFPTLAPRLQLWEDDPHATSPDLYGRRPVSTRVQLDDVDLSDDEPDVVEVKKTLKRLPGAKDLRQANLAPTFGAFGGGAGGERRSIDTVSSYGAPIQGGMGGGRETVLFEDEGEDLLAAGAQFIPGFILDGLDESDEEDAGDVEAALRRLEGIVDEDKQREKAAKVERQMERSVALQSRMAGGQAVARLAEDGLGTTAEDSDEEESQAALAPAIVLEDGPAREAEVVPAPASASIGSVGRRGGMGLAPSTAHLAPIANRPQSSLAPPTAALKPGPSRPPRHRCFVLLVRTDVLAAQFGLIERDMLRGLDWLELVSGAWARRAENVDVLDWQAYLQNMWRQQYLAREGKADKPSTVLPVIARFNLMTHWVASEILLTADLEERAALVGRFIKLAFRCYALKNFQTLAQLVHGLQLPEVEGLRKTWSRVGQQEKHQLGLLKAFVSPAGNWRLLREGTSEALAPFGPLGAGQEYEPREGEGAKGKKSKAPPVCLPFLGLFLRDLRALEELPTFRDPSDLAADAQVSADGELVRVARPDAFADSKVFPPLPEGQALRPLVNAHKLRVQADVLEVLLRAKRWAAGTDGGAQEGMQRAVFVKCLRIGSAGEEVRRQLGERVE